MAFHSQFFTLWKNALFTAFPVLHCPRQAVSKLLQTSNAASKPNSPSPEPTSGLWRRKALGRPRLHILAPLPAPAGPRFLAVPQSAPADGNHPPSSPATRSVAHRLLPTRILPESAASAPRVANRRQSAPATLASAARSFPSSCA